MFDFNNIDWNAILFPVLQGLLTFLATALTTYFIVLARAEWVKLQESRPDLVDKIQGAAQFAYGVVEQLRKNGQLPSDLEAREYAEAIVEKYLKAKGIDIDLTPFAELIVAAIEKAVNDNRNIVATTSVTTVESSPSKIVAPKKTSTAVTKVEEVPSVVTTTTSSATTDSSSVVPAVSTIAETVVPSVDGSVG